MRTHFIFYPVLIAIFSLNLAGDAHCQHGDIEEKKELRQEILILNLINGLYLSDEQGASLLGKAREANSLREKFIQQQRLHSESSSETLEQLKDEIKEDKGYVSGDVAHEVHESQTGMLKLRAEYDKKISRIVQDVKETLTENQLYTVQTFRPCLVPPKGPARAGQADDSARGVEQLERIRKIPDSAYDSRKYELADKVVQRFLLYKPRSPEMDGSKAKERIISIYDEARSLSDLDFEVKKEKLAKRIKEDIMPERKEEDPDIKIQRFLLSTSAVSVLEEKIALDQSASE